MEDSFAASRAFIGVFPLFGLNTLLKQDISSYTAGAARTRASPLMTVESNIDERTSVVIDVVHVTVSAPVGTSAPVTLGIVDNDRVDTAIISLSAQLPLESGRTADCCSYI